ncbi:inositol 1,4,5-trisphosphate receptor-interacting protein-like 1 [Melanerpes formicivorus]|uniref:inositol 1,4,5-trisphosphate receptor-interacting protein-like 1 n=1 Tax=Melanerpes formicivorus TaxID=211600 RepID=UPI00358EBF08
MKQREEYLQQEMARLLQQMEQGSNLEKVMRLCVLKSWQFQMVAIPVLIVVLLLTWRRNLAYDSCSEGDSSSSMEEGEEEEWEEEEWEKEEDLNGAHSCIESLAVATPLPMQELSDTPRMLKALVGELLSVCQVLCRKTFMPQIEPASGGSGTCELWDVQEHSITYFLVVSLQPPHGHTFSLEPDTTGKMPAKSVKVHVGLECVCSREQLLGDTVCFLHHSDDRLPRDQSSYLLCNLCTHCYLDLEKVACWVQQLVSSAWMLLPQSYHWQLTVLPSSKSCTFQLTGISKMNICTELSFAVQSDSTGASLVLA